MKLDYDLIEKHGINYIDPRSNLVRYFKVDGDTVTYYSHTYKRMFESCYSAEWCEDFLIPVSKKEGDFNYKLASYEKASQAIADFETGAESFWIFAKDARYYKLDSAAAICKSWAKGTLFTRREVKKSWAERVAEELDWVGVSYADSDFLECEVIEYDKDSAVRFAKAILKATGETC